MRGEPATREDGELSPASSPEYFPRGHGYPEFLFNQRRKADGTSEDENPDVIDDIKPELSEFQDDAEVYNKGLNSKQKGGNFAVFSYVNQITTMFPKVMTSSEV